jgi:hypothetical protein
MNWLKIFLITIILLDYKKINLIIITKNYKMKKKFFAGLEMTYSYFQYQIKRVMEL